MVGGVVTERGIDDTLHSTCVWLMVLLQEDDRLIQFKELKEFIFYDVTHRGNARLVQ